MRKVCKYNSFNFKWFNYNKPNGLGLSLQDIDTGA